MRLLALVLACMLPIAARAQGTATPARPTDVTDAAIAIGDSIYHSGGCQRCHGQKGVGANNGPSLVSGAWVQQAGSFDELVATSTHGVPREKVKDASRRFPMGPRGGPMNLDDAQVRAVAAYVWSISRAKTPPAAP
ncbi:MAG: c-type cytochrome [Gemmatimonadota bacterium]